MSFRTVVIAERAKLETKLGYLVVRGETEKRIHLSEIDTLIIETTSAAITAGLLCELVKLGVNVMFCNEKHLPVSQLVSLCGHHTASKHAKRQAQWREDVKADAWARIVYAKIDKQQDVLCKFGKTKEASMLLGFQNAITPNDASNREGHAAKVYFNALFDKDFSRRAENEYNPPLNYGYAMLMSAFAREIICAGY